MQSAQETIYMDAVLTPNRSLSRQGFFIAMLAIAVTFFLNGLMFWSMGALPILGFMGLDVLAIWLAFHISFRRQKEETRVTVTARAICLHHKDAKGGEKFAEVPSAFARVKLAEPAGPGDWLRIEHGKTAWVIGRFLTPDERKSFASALRQALASARAERYPA
ncbi:DUF2244 domain-containing protein [Hyphomonas sp. WL0036]|uniref:DUF2244 domain-containing protein n=1 Tax=Hyphomonas sediminis TaxID=2866160 RepID=UPI001C80E521|nr:DUF2244 domain-containing protein [Hyphomonas sediminis]MBY9067862.1 DUF2244 domain-containing protein [Hyphomonas sediminis]